MTDEGIVMAPEAKRYVTRAALTARVLLGVTLLLVGAGLLAEWFDRRADGVDDPLFLVRAIIVFACAMWNLAGAVRAGLWADGQGITVRGPLRTRRLAWSDVASFRMDASAGWAAKCLRIHLRSGEAIKVSTILEPRFGPKYKTSTVQELNDTLAIATVPVRPDAR